ncbi:MAG TPA: 3-dehydroquinate synthase [Candidatus Angelobacter sp.]|nr:3-dehydroquinate synthase [Candidatus Angelobacter sp.]
MADPRRITVRSETDYDVVVGRGLDADLAAALPESVRRVAVVHSAARVLDGRRVADIVAATGVEPVLVPVPDGEEAKTAEVAARCWSILGQAGLTRSDAVIGVGGGATTDLAGFVAATWLRGVRLVQVPTTLLGMVDAAVGGKTGINTPEGKNLVGAFHPPSAVVCDLDSLASLPAVDVAAGMAEVVKVGLTSDARILDLVESGPDAALDPNGDVLGELVARAVTVKADVVSADLRESRPGGLGREVLNYGHTFGHAVELVERYRWRHGHAVSVGLVYVAALARLAGRLPERDEERHVELLRSLGLPTTYPGGRFPELLAAMRIDKKARGDLLRFVVLDGIGRPGLLEGPDPDLLSAAYAVVAKET